jgi:hypothetical protein
MMTDEELSHALRSWRVPPSNRERVERALNQSIKELGVSSAPVVLEPRRRYRNIVLAGVPVAAVLGLLLLTPRLRSPARKPSTAAYMKLCDEDSIRMLEEVRALFPHCLQGLVVRDANIALRLHAAPTSVSDQPILVELAESGADPVHVLSYSGEIIELNIADRVVRMEFLLAGDGTVLVLTDDFVWSKQGAIGVGDLRIRARSLGVPS